MARNGMKSILGAMLESRHYVPRGEMWMGWAGRRSADVQHRHRPCVGAATRVEDRRLAVAGAEERKAMIRFDPNNVLRGDPYDCGLIDDPNGTCVYAKDYDALLALYNAERQARKDDAKEFQREARDIAAEARWAERESHE